MAKLAPRDLARVLSSLPPQPHNDDLIVGYENADDAGVFRLREDLALVQTVDFFTPVADDPEVYGRIAAINCLNDIYAMGGKPLTALSIVCYPQREDLDVLGHILRGGQVAMNQEGVLVLGGHSVDDAEIKFGYAVTGVIDPGKVITNANAKPGDALVLTKPIGTGAISTAIKMGIASDNSIQAAISAMCTSAASASKAMIRFGAHACTDVTGFGLLGHAYELAKASSVSLVIETARVPLLPEVLELIGRGMLTRGDKNNRAYVEDQVRFSADVNTEWQSTLFDPQTAGGLLISIDAAKSEELAREVSGHVIGRVIDAGEVLIEVV